MKIEATSESDALELLFQMATIGSESLPSGRGAVAAIARKSTLKTAYEALKAAIKEQN